MARTATRAESNRSSRAARVTMHSRGLALLARVVVPVLFALFLPFASAGLVPALVRMLAPDVHACHCSPAEHDCLCVRCHPDRPELRFSESSLVGRCGDDLTTMTGGKLVSSLPSSGHVIAPACSDETSVRCATVAWVDQLAKAPPKPPPRNVLL